MALATRTQNKIKAEWKAGKWKTAYAISKAYKIDQKTAQKIIDGIMQDNAEIVEVGVIYENAKKSIKNPVEKRAIEQLIIERTLSDDIHDEVLSGTLDNIRSLRKKIQKEEIEYISDHRNAQETFDKALITAGKAPRHAPKQDINLTNAQQNNEEKRVTIVRRSDRTE